MSGDFDPNRMLFYLGQNHVKDTSLYPIIGLKHEGGPLF